MLLALIYLHEKIKVIHRDIKPNNFLLKKEDKKIIIKLKDFDNAEFDKALEEYNNRHRRFGGN